DGSTKSGIAEGIHRGVAGKCAFVDIQDKTKESHAAIRGSGVAKERAVRDRTGPSHQVDGAVVRKTVTRDGVVGYRRSRDGENAASSAGVVELEHAAGSAGNIAVESGIRDGDFGREGDAGDSAGASRA